MADSAMPRVQNEHVVTGIASALPERKLAVIGLCPPAKLGATRPWAGPMIGRSAEEVLLAEEMEQLVL